MLSVDWAVNMADFRRSLPANVGVQGNLDPIFLRTTEEAAADETNRILNDMKGLNGHIFNLGHGVTPESQIANIEKVVTTVRSFSA